MESKLIKIEGLPIFDLSMNLSFGDNNNNYNKETPLNIIEII